MIAIIFSREIAGIYSYHQPVSQMPSQGLIETGNWVDYSTAHQLDSHLNLGVFRKSYFGVNSLVR